MAEIQREAHLSAPRPHASPPLLPNKERKSYGGGAEEEWRVGGRGCWSLIRPWASSTQELAAQTSIRSPPLNHLRQFLHCKPPPPPSSLFLPSPPSPPQHPPQPKPPRGPLLKQIFFIRLASAVCQWALIAARLFVMWRGKERETQKKKKT